MDSSRAFITKLVDDGGLNEARRCGITADFLSEDAGPVYNFIERYFSEYKQVPTRDAILKAFSSWEFGVSGDPLEYHIDQLKESYRRGILEEKLTDLSAVYNSDTQKAERILRESLSAIQVTSKTFKDVNIAESSNERFDAYLKRKDEPPVDGIKSRWPTMDNQTLGWHNEEFIVLVAEKYVGKSWLLIDEAVVAAQQGQRVLFATSEMSTDAIIRRHDSIYANICFDSLRKGELTNVEEQRYREKLEELSNSVYNFTVARDGVQTIEDIETKAVETDADIVFCDSVYLFLPDSKQSYQGEVNKRLAISQRCKRMARNLAVPVIVSVQAGRKKSAKQTPSLDDIEWSNAFSQDADTVFYVEKKVPIDIELNRRKIYLLKSRDGDMAEFYINANFENMLFDEREDTDKPTTDIQFDTEDDLEMEWEDAN